VNDKRIKRLTPLGDLLDGLLEEAMPDHPDLRESLAAGAFLSAVGPAVAGRCRVLGLAGGVLSVAVMSQRWQGELQRMGGDILGRVNAALPSRARLSAIDFRLEA